MVRIWSIFKKMSRGSTHKEGLPSIKRGGILKHINRNEPKVEEKSIQVSKLTEENEHVFTEIFNNLDVGMWSLDVKSNHYILISKGVEIITGFSKRDFQGNLTWESLVHPDDVEKYQSLQSKLEMGESLHHQYRIINRMGETIWVQDQTMPMHDANGNLTRIVGIIYNITVQKDYENQIQHIAYHDQLTGLPNRILFEDKLRDVMSRVDNNTALSIMYLNVGRLRSINQSLGHAIGDQLIQKFCQHINTLLPKTSYFSKTGGDEFGVILWGYGQSDYPVSMAKTIVDSLKEPFMINDYELFLTCSIGIANYPTNGATVQELIKNASAALYRAEAMGKNNYHIYSSALNINTYKQYELERDLRKSIDNGELVIYFQPRVNVATGKIVSAEALIRWQHPVWGLVSPGEFITLAEEIGYINEISDWVVYQACKHLAKWTDESLPIVPISINISAQRFLRKDWKSAIINALSEFNVDPSLIELEITESTIIEYEKEVESAFAILRELGIKIALDDFGTGYSSLKYIKNFPIDTIKIDQTFTRQITKTPHVEMIIKSLIFMAKGLEMNVVVEGVETIEQLNFLRQQECQEIQGYIFSKPVPEEEFKVLLKKIIIKPKYKSVQTIVNNRRKYFRIPLVFPISAHMTLTSIRQKRVELGKTEVLIENIGPGGLRFLSNIQLPIRPDITFQISIELMGHNEIFNGHVVWKEEVKGIFQYGFQFDMDEKDRDGLIKKLNQLALQQRDNPYLLGCKFIEEDKYSYLKKNGKESSKA
ncbi:MAG: EAL domain-containing protein [Tuberibacillus sp.]